MSRRADTGRSSRPGEGDARQPRRAARTTGSLAGHWASERWNVRRDLQWPRTTRLERLRQAAKERTTPDRHEHPQATDEGRATRSATPALRQKRLTMWLAILRHYDTNHKLRVTREEAWFASSSTIEDAISRAALATDERGKRCHHQRRITKTAMQAARASLLERKDEVNNATTFDELLTTVTNAMSDIHGIGELYRYDAALRIGTFLGLTPEKVYLHSGT